MAGGKFLLSSGFHIKSCLTAGIFSRFFKSTIAFGSLIIFSNAQYSFAPSYVRKVFPSTVNSFRENGTLELWWRQYFVVAERGYLSTAYSASPEQDIWAKSIDSELLSVKSPFVQVAVYHLPLVVVTRSFLFVTICTGRIRRCFEFPCSRNTVWFSIPRTIMVFLSKHEGQSAPRE